MGPYSRTGYDNRMFRIGPDGHLDQSEAYDISVLTNLCFIHAKTF